MRISGIAFTSGALCELLQERFRRLARSYGFTYVSPPSIVEREIYEDVFRDTQARVFSIEPLSRGLILAPEHTRVLAKRYTTDPSLPRVWKTYSIEKTWRDERSQKGRFKEFYQLNIEILRRSVTLLDIINVISLILDFFEGIDFSLGVSCVDTITRILKERILRECTEDRLSELYRAIDKGVPFTVIIEKFPEIEDKTLFLKIFEEKDIELFLNLSKELFLNSDLSGFMDSLFKTYPSVYFNPRILRGLNYYTGVVFEGTLDTPDSKSSVVGGGQYKILDAQGVGFAIGLTRLLAGFTKELSERPELPVYLKGPLGEIILNYPSLIKILQRSNGYLLRTKSLRGEGIEIDLDTQKFYFKGVAFLFTELERFLQVIAPQPEFESGSQP